MVQAPTSCRYPRRQQVQPQRLSWSYPRPKSRLARNAATSPSSATRPFHPLHQIVMAASTMILVLRLRPSTAFMSITTSPTRFHQTLGAKLANRLYCAGWRGGRTIISPMVMARGPSFPLGASMCGATAAADGGGVADATFSPAAVGKQAGQGDTRTESRSGDVPVEERYLMREERKQRRKAREARKLSVGRAKSVRRTGSSTESVGLETLHPPKGPPGSGAPALSGLPDMSKPFTVLGIETSCDDTAAAVVRSDGAVLGEAIAGQAEVHEEWGGVVPGLARDLHASKMDGVVGRALKQAGLTSPAEVDAVAVTVGPGLEICLRVGTEKAKALASQYHKPFVAIHHLEAHALLARKAFSVPPPNAAADAGAGASSAPRPSSGAAPNNDVSDAVTVASAAPSTEAFAAAFTANVANASSAAATSPSTSKTSSGGPVSTVALGVEDDNVNRIGTRETPPLEFPFLALLVSGGHCQLLLCEGVGSYKVLGGTIDDALGEAYDKAARLLGLKVGGGGGPAVEKLALAGDPTAVPLAVPMQSRKDLDFSFAGLKNSFRMAVTKAVGDDHQRRMREGVAETRSALVDEEDSKGTDIGAGDDKALSPTASLERKGSELPASTRADLAASFQHTAIRHLEERVRRAMDTCENLTRFSAEASSDRNRATEEGPLGYGMAGGYGTKAVRALAVVGGVAANQELRRRLQALCDEREPEAWQMVVPPARLCTDNGVMVAWAAVERLREGMSNKAEGQEVYPRLPIGRCAGDDDLSGL